MNARRLIFLTAWTLALLVGVGCTNQQTGQGNSQAGQDSLQASLRLGWIPSGSYAGEIVGMKQFATEHGLDLTVEAGGQGLNAVTLVQTGANTFGTIGAAEVIAANDKGASLVIIGVNNYNSPTAFISLPSSNITQPQDFEGREVGVLPFGSTTLAYRALLRENDVDRSKITEITVSPDLRPFLNGNYAVHPGFAYDETVTLDRQEVDYNLIKPEEFGVDLKGPVYFTKRSTLEESPEVVKAFIKTMADGWNYALENQEQAILALKEYAPEINVEREKQVLAKGADYFRAYKGQPVNSDIESWNDMIEELRRLEVTDNPVDLSNLLDLSFIHEYYSSGQQDDVEGENQLTSS